MDRRSLPLIALLALAPCATVEAACPLEEIELIGFVRNADGAPVTGAAVEASWEEKAAGTVSTRRETVGDGSFLLKVAYDTYSGKTFTGKDKCETRIDTATLVVTHPDYDTLTREVGLEAGTEPLELSLTAR